MSTDVAQLFAKGGWVMWPLLVFSVLTWTVALERAVMYLKLRPRLVRLTKSLLDRLRGGDLAGARELCLAEEPELHAIFLGALEPERSLEWAERVMERNRAQFMAHLKRNLWILGTIGSASPFIGLLGTVLGIVRAFQEMSVKGAGGFAVVSGGISEALVSTAAGLIVAILALFVYNVLVSAANRTTSDLKFGLEEMLQLSYEKARRPSAA